MRVEAIFAVINDMTAAMNKQIDSVRLFSFLCYIVKKLSLSYMDLPLTTEFPSLELRGPNMLQLDNAPVHKAP